MTKLLRAVEQTVRKYENNAVGKHDEHCYFCRYYECESTGLDVNTCPIATTEPEEDCFGNICNTRIRAIYESPHDTPSCLAIMVYVWGFECFGQDWRE